MNEAVGFAERSPPLPPSPSAREPWAANLPNGRQDDAVDQNGDDFGLEEAVTHEVEVDGVAWTSVVGHPSQGPGSSREFAYTCDFVLFDEDRGRLAVMGPLHLAPPHWRHFQSMLWADRWRRGMSSLLSATPKVARTDTSRLARSLILKPSQR